MGSRLEANSSAVRKRIEKHKFEDEGGEEYEPSKFGGFNDYFRRKKIKLQNLDAETRASSTNNPPIFRAVVAHVNGYTQPSLNDLHKLIVSHGGGFMQYLDGKTTVTHIIASNLTPKKKVEFSKYRIVKPAWVVDSIEAGKLLPWDAYRVVDEGIGQRVLGFENGSVISQVNSLPIGYRDQTDTSWYTAQVKGVAERLNSSLHNLPSSSNELSLVSSGDTEPLEAPSQTDNRRAEYNEHGDLVSNTPTGKKADEDLDMDGLPAIDDPLLESQPDSFPEQDTKARNKGLNARTFDTLSQPTPSEGNAPVKGNSDNDVVDRFHANDSGHIPSIEEFMPFDSYALRGNASAELVSANEAEPQQYPLRVESPVEHSDAVARHPQLSPQGLDTTDATSPTKPTAEEHNAQLLADPRVWKSTVVNPNFLKQYYEESRLHHLSAWKADLKSQLQRLAAEKTLSQKAKAKHAPGSRRYILHIDFDSFFAAVSLLKYPQYVNKPVVVAHGGGSGSEIASCNYPARKFGIKNGMWMKHAQKMCPELKVLPYDFKAYEDASRSFYDAIMDTGGIVQSVSVDEALLDISAQCIAAGGHDGRAISERSIWREQATADEIGTGLRETIKRKTGCAVSVGIGGNILLAKVALRKAKPAGQYHLKPEDVLEFLGALTVQELPGVAWSIGGKLEEIGVRYVRDVRELSKERMITTLGPKTGEKIWDYARGIDRVEVGEQVIRKSVSAEVNWGIRFVTQEQAEEFVQSLCEELHKRLLNEQVKGRQLTMKIMRRAADAPLDPPKHLGHGKCDTFNKSLILGVPTNDKNIISREAISILRGFGFSPGELRGLGVQMQRLEPLKGTVESPQDSSQKRLQFKTSTGPSPKHTLSRDDTKADDIDSPQKPKVPSGPHPAAAFSKDVSPSGKPRKPLNTLGTQFVIPTQVDPEVLAELPSDIRSKLLPKQSNNKLEESREQSSVGRSRSNTPTLPPEVVPSHSQLDPEILDALPDDVRAEILAYYHKSPHKPSAQAAQALLPQSPRKARTTKLPKKLITPTKKRTGLLSRSKNSTSSFSTLTQSNFVYNPRPSSSSSKPITEDTPADIPDDFLAALPPDIRRELLAQARRDRLQKKGSIDVTSSKRKRAPPAYNNQAPPTGQRTLTLPPPPPKPTFTAKKFSTLPELREAVSAWVEEFKEEGPYGEDVGVLVGYLERVVREERDMAKAVGVVKWLGWVVDEVVVEGGEEGPWGMAVERVRRGVQEAVRARGMGEVIF